MTPRFSFLFQTLAFSDKFFFFSVYDVVYDGRVEPEGHVDIQ